MNPSLYLAPATGRSGAYEYFERSVRTGVKQDFYSKFTDSKLGDPARIWGLTSSIQSNWETINKGDWFLFYTEENKYEYAAQVTGTEHNESLGEALRKEMLDTDHDDYRDWDLLVFLNNPVPVTISGEQVQKLFDYGHRYPVRFTRVIDDRLDSLHAEYGDIDQFIDSIRDEN
jgi:hypothetical protein